MTTIDFQVDGQFKIVVGWILLANYIWSVFIIENLNKKLQVGSDGLLKVY